MEMKKELKNPSPRKVHQSLIVRNGQMAIEIAQIRSKNANLRKELIQLRKKSFKISLTAETQTTPELLESYLKSMIETREEERLPRSHSHSSEQMLPEFLRTPSPIKTTLEPSISPRSSRNCIGECAKNYFENDETVTKSHLKPVVVRLSFSDSNLISPVISPTRTRQRKASRPTSYKEPPLNTKIRKGHEFFKFSK